MFLRKCFIFCSEAKNLGAGGVRWKQQQATRAPAGLKGRSSERHWTPPPRVTSSQLRLARGSPSTSPVTLFAPRSLPALQGAGSVVGVRMLLGGRVSERQKWPPSLQSWLAVNFDPEKLHCGMRGISDGPRYLIGVARL